MMRSAWSSHHWYSSAEGRGLARASATLGGPVSLTLGTSRKGIRDSPEGSAGVWSPAGFLAMGEGLRFRDTNACLSRMEISTIWDSRRSSMLLSSPAGSHRGS